MVTSTEVAIIELRYATTVSDARFLAATLLESLYLGCTIHNIFLNDFAVLKK